MTKFIFIRLYLAVLGPLSIFNKKNRIATKIAYPVLQLSQKVNLISKKCPNTEEASNFSYYNSKPKTH